MAQTVTGLFDHLSQARAAVRDLHDNGYENNDISLVANASDETYSRYFDEEGNYQTVTHEEMTAGEGASAGAGIGATIGGIGGLLMGLGLLAIPGVGPALAAGPIVSTLVGAGIGAASGGIAGALVNAGVPEERAHYYAEGVRRGGSIVMVKVDEANATNARDILNRHHPVNVDERARDWRDHGYEAFDPKAENYTSEQIERERATYRHAPVPENLADAYYDHYTTTYGGGATYTSYEPAYYLGRSLARDPAFENRNWTDVQGEAEQRWLERNTGPWVDYRDAVRYAYETEHRHA
ncbi:MAG: hypothetical protein KC422_03910 [Trueperaceae bacterium]|nr:hypothetical protein [Trueperaceae bacterium]